MKQRADGTRYETWVGFAARDVALNISQMDTASSHELSARQEWDTASDSVWTVLLTQCFKLQGRKFTWQNVPRDTDTAQEVLCNWL